MAAGSGSLDGMKLVIEDVDRDDPEALTAWNDLMRRGYNVTREAAWWRSADATIAQFTNPKPGRTSVLVRALVDGEPAGGAEANADGDSPVDLEIAVLPEFRRKGVATKLAQAVRKALPDAKVFSSEVYSDEGVAFAKACGLKVGNREVRQLLDWPVDTAVLEGLDEVVDGLEIDTWTGPCPTDLVEQMARLRTVMEEDVPVGELTRNLSMNEVADMRQNEQRMEAQGYTVLTAFARVDGEAAGYTQIFVDQNAPEIVIQDDTLVDREFRGRGVGRALKLANLRALTELDGSVDAKWVQTYTAADNKPMIKLNTQLGFREADVMTALEGKLK